MKILKNLDEINENYRLSKIKEEPFMYVQKVTNSLYKININMWNTYNLKENAEFKLRKILHLYMIYRINQNPCKEYIKYITKSMAGIYGGGIDFIMIVVKEDLNYVYYLIEKIVFDKTNLDYFWV